MKTKTLRWITLAGTVLCLAVTMITGIKVNSQSVDYEKVQARILSADKLRVKRLDYYYKVVVEYHGNEYELINIRTEEFARYQGYIGSYATVYFANGKMYSNITGIKTDGKMYYIYMGALISTIILFVLHIVLIKDNVHKKKPMNLKLLAKEEKMHDIEFKGTLNSTNAYVLVDGIKHHVTKKTVERFKSLVNGKEYAETIEVFAFQIFIQKKEKNDGWFD
ncbi:MAG: hypothetical protein UFG06_13160 [Lachnospiraceae bacterium]|nr:hypothetical protein [Lachnospiraceae bacterium]